MVLLHRSRVPLQLIAPPQLSRSLRLAFLAVALWPAVQTRADRTLSHLGYAELVDENTTVVLATKGDFNAALKEVGLAVTQVHSFFNYTMREGMDAFERALKEEEEGIKEEMKLFMESAEKELRELQVQERRLRLAVRHGTLGRCCCHGLAKAQCEWVDMGLLNGYRRQCPESAGEDYIDHHRKALAQEEKVSADALVDNCLESKGWQQHIEGAASIWSATGPAKGQATEELNLLQLWAAFPGQKSF